ncbi:MAG TPA: 2-dehydropantoate 2-reductase N-terminal domain-containing protein [Candidatus Obscuribacterales bacterium]
MQINNVLILGAGAVGQVIGTHLRLSGCDVTFWVRASQREALENKGLTIYNVKTETELHISAPQVVTRVPADSKYDALFICVRSDQLDAALAQVKEEIPALEDLVVIPIQPGRDDGLKTFRALPEAIVVPLTPTFSAFFGENRVDYWAPKWMPTLVGPPFNETLHVRDEIVRLLSQGGIPAKGVNDLEAEVRFPSAALQVLLGAFHLSDYSIKKLSQNKKLLQLTAQGVRESAEIVKRDLGFIPVKFKALEHISAETIQALLWSMEHSPLSDFLDKMWGVHARKIHEQTFRNLDDLLALSLQQTKHPPVALTAMTAMTPEKIGEYLKTTRQFSGQDPQKTLKLGVALGLGGLLLWRMVRRARS